MYISSIPIHNTCSGTSEKMTSFHVNYIEIKNPTRNIRSCSQDSPHFLSLSKYMRFTMLLQAAMKLLNKLILVPRILSGKILDCFGGLSKVLIILGGQSGYNSIVSMCVCLCVFVSVHPWFSSSSKIPKIIMLLCRRLNEKQLIQPPTGESDLFGGFYSGCPSDIM